MERLLPPHQMEMYDQMDPVSILRQTMNGIQHLHSLKIVHRDIKPQNILLAPSKHGTDLRVLLSDFGLCKKLDGEQTSFHYTAISPAGTVGWRAPELLKGCIAVEEFAKSQNSQSDHKSDTSVYSQQETKATRAIDIFSTGCLFYYVLTGGDHPYGDRFARESNILKGEYDLDKLTSMGEDGVDAMDLIESMLDPVPGERPTASKVLSHPFFWNPTQRLAFLQDVSDRLEVEKREPPSPLLMRLEKDADKIIGHDWYRRIDRVVAQDLRKFRKYDGKRVRDLLRALRNKVGDIIPVIRKKGGMLNDCFFLRFRNTIGKICQIMSRSVWVSPRIDICIISRQDSRISSCTFSISWRMTECYAVRVHYGNISSFVCLLLCLHCII